MMACSQISLKKVLFEESPLLVGEIMLAELLYALGAEGISAGTA